MSKYTLSAPFAVRQGGLYGLGGFLETSPESLSEQGVKTKSEQLRELSASDCFLIAALLEFYGGLSNATLH
jgi:hypothetical protein